MGRNGGGSRVGRDHAIINGFESALRSLRGSAHEVVELVGNILLPLKVETHVEHEPLYWMECGSRVIYLDMKSALDEYSGVSEGKEFKQIVGTTAVDAESGRASSVTHG